MSVVFDMLNESECVECSDPGARWFLWRASEDRVHVMRATRSAKAKITGSVWPVPIVAIDLVLSELGAAKAADMLKWTPCGKDVPLGMVARLPLKLTRMLSGTQATNSHGLALG